MSIFQGTTRECFDHLVHALGSDNLPERKEIAVFAKVQEATVLRWFKNRLPKGRQMVSLRYYLEHIGYKVKELDDLQTEVRVAGKLYAFGIIQWEAIATAVGNTDPEKGDRMTRELFSGISALSHERLSMLRKFVKFHEDQLASKVASVTKVGPGAGIEEHEAGEVIPIQDVLKDTLIEVGSNLVIALIPIAKRLESDEFTAEERTHFRNLAGGDGVFNLANILHRLCGERRREMYLEEISMQAMEVQQ